MWLKVLVDGGKLPPGRVDNRDIRDLTPADLDGYVHCHFFAGIGGWPLALELAGWPEAVPVWTGSPPCQPFSLIGKKKGFNDERDLWPIYAKLIRTKRPPILFGEQVANAVANGWYDRLSDDLEAAGYTVGAAVIGACAVGAPHKRQRLFWVAVSSADKANLLRALGDADQQGLERHTEHGEGSCKPGRQPAQADGYVATTSGLWGDGLWCQLADGKTRLVKPGIRLLVDGVPNRVVKLRGLGNAIVPQVAAEFIKSCILALTDTANCVS